MKKKEIAVRLAIVGSPAAGKTTLVKQFTGARVPIRYIPTIGVQTKRQKVEYRNAIVESVFWDLAGQEVFRGSASLYIKQTELVLVLFDLSNPASHIASYQWCETIKQKVKDVCMIVIGNKMDIVINPNDILEQIKYNLSGIKINGYYLVSAITGEGVDRMFYESIAKAVSLKTKKEKRKKLKQTKLIGGISVGM